jgi:hypothetical protein
VPKILAASAIPDLNVQTRLYYFLFLARESLSAIIEGQHTSWLILGRGSLVDSVNGGRRADGFLMEWSI